MTLNEIASFSQIERHFDLIARIQFRKVTGTPVHASDEQLKEALSHELFIKRYHSAYIKFVKEHFKNNTILMNKWLRYAENIRSLNG
jgi:hypothetical protein